MKSKSSSANIAVLLALALDRWMMRSGSHKGLSRNGLLCCARLIGIKDKSQDQVQRSRSRTKGMVCDSLLILRSRAQVNDTDQGHRSRETVKIEEKRQKQGSRSRGKRKGPKWASCGFSRPTSLAHCQMPLEGH